MEQIAPKSLQEGQVFKLGSVTFSEQDIIEFAKQYDPLPFHTDVEAAQKSHFKGLVASGPHPFFVLHKREWIPRFGHSVLAGISLTDWTFHQPVYAHQTIRLEVEVAGLKINSEKGHVVITWIYRFLHENKELAQDFKMSILHRWI